MTGPLIAESVLAVIAERFEKLEQNVILRAMAKLSEGTLTPDAALVLWQEIHAARRVNSGLVQDQRRLKGTQT